MSAGEQGGNRQRPHFLRYFPLIQGVSLIRFLKIRGHLGQNLSIRNSHIYRKFKFFKNRVTNESSGFLGRDVVRRNGRIVHITFIDADLFDVGADTRQMFHKHLAFQTVHIMIRRSHDQMRTFAQGIDHRFTGSDAESLGGNGFGQHHTVSGGGVTAYDGRDRAQIHRIPLFQTGQRRPA